MREYVLVLLVAAAVTYLLTPLVRRFAVATKAMHAPRARDTHTEATPLLGGLAMYGGLVAGLIVASRLSFLQDPFQTAGSHAAAGLLLAGGLIVILGFVDDRWGLSAISKLAGQVAAAGVLVWSGQALPWLPTPNGGVFPLEQDLSWTLTILIVVVTINAINFIDGLDGLAAGIVAVAALSFLAYSYTLNRTLGTTSQSVPAVASALLAGMCLGFLPHNFYPAKIFMGDIGAMLLGLLLAYGPISSTDSLDPALLTNYSHGGTLDRFPTFLPLLVPAAIFVIPYADLMFAIIRRTRAGKSIMSADRQHLHHRLMNIGHSYRQSVLIMYLWAALFSVTVVSLSIVRTKLVLFAAATVVAALALLPVTMPSLRPWRISAKRRAVRPAPRPAAPVPGTPVAATAPHPADQSWTNGIRPNGPAVPASVPLTSPSHAAAPVQPTEGPPPASGATASGATANRAPAGYGTFTPASGAAQSPPDAALFPGKPYMAAPPTSLPPTSLPPTSLPRAGRLPGTDAFFGQPASAAGTGAQPYAAGADSLPAPDPFAARDAYQSRDAFPSRDGYPGPDAHQPGDRFPGRDAYPSRDGYPGRDAYQPRDAYPDPNGLPGRDASSAPDPFGASDPFPPSDLSGAPDSFPPSDPFPGQQAFPGLEAFPARAPLADPDRYPNGDTAPQPVSPDPDEAFPPAQRPDAQPR